MCGIFGFFDAKIEKEKGNEILRKMAQVLKHRGPDDEGFYTAKNFYLGNVLLSIVDIGNGLQPFIKEWNGKKAICIYNGELYNYLDLKKILEKNGFVFDTMCDTEVVVASYLFWGEECFKHFDGQWAIAILDETDNEILLSRDPFGIKPLFFYSNNEIFAFASEPKGIFCHYKINKEPNNEAIIEYLLHGFAFASGYSTGERSFYKNINSVRPGTYIKWSLKNGLIKRNYFSLPLGNEYPIDKIDFITEQVKESVEKSVYLTLMGDAPIGTALSGGVDSSIITTLAARYLQQQGISPLLSASISYKDQEENEDAEHAQLLVNFLKDKYKIKLKLTNISVERYLSDLDNLIYHFDEPHWEVKQLAMFKNYKTLKINGAKVVLTGEGADELYLGYFHKFPGFLDPVINSSDELIELWKLRFPILEKLFQNGYSEKFLPLIEEAIENFYKPYDTKDIEPFRRMQCWYIHTFLHWLLIDNDRCSMAYSLEGRFPYLNKIVYETALKIPTKLQVGDEYGMEKLILRNAFKDILPEKIWKHRKKAPLPSPIAIEYHKSIAKAFEQSIDEVPDSIWELFNKKEICNFLDYFKNKLNDKTYHPYLTSYLKLKDKWDIRTPQVFAILTILRWWKINFS